MIRVFTPSQGCTVEYKCALQSLPFRILCEAGALTGQERRQSLLLLYDPPSQSFDDTASLDQVDESTPENRAQAIGSFLPTHAGIGRPQDGEQLIDRQPELLFRLHDVDQEELIAKVSKALPLAKEGPARSKVLGSEDLSGIFGLEMAEGTGADTELSAVTDAKPRPRKARADKTATTVGTGSGKLRTQRSSSKRQKPVRGDASRLRRRANPGAS